MTEKEWINKVRENQDKLIDLISSFHPSSVRPRLMNERIELTDGSSIDIPLTITAPTAEAACEVCREKIRKEEQGQLDPVERFRTCLTAENVDGIYDLLSSAWFGVPESTECWHLAGFKEAVDLMDDPPDQQ